MPARKRQSLYILVISHLSLRLKADRFIEQLTAVAYATFLSS